LIALDFLCMNARIHLGSSVRDILFSSLSKVSNGIAPVRVRFRKSVAMCDSALFPCA
jgi:hypothetical protein